MEKYYIEEEYLITWGNLGQSKICRFNLKIYIQIKIKNVNTKTETDNIIHLFLCVAQKTYNAK